MRRSVLVKVPDFSANADAGSTTSAWKAVSVEEEILHHQMLEHRERFARMLEIGVGHRRVFALDIHAPDRAGMDRVHDLDDGQPTLAVERLAPELLEHAAHLLPLDCW